jgi:esterase/lipase
MMLELGKGEFISDSDLEKVTHSVLVARGSHDTMVSKEESEVTVQKISNSIYLELENAQHPIDKIEITQLVSLITENN